MIQSEFSAKEVADPKLPGVLLSRNNRKLVERDGSQALTPN
jgi:hypothetical protein